MRHGDEVTFEAADGSGELAAQVVGETRTEAGVPLYEVVCSDPAAETKHRRRFTTWAKEGRGPGRIHA